MSLPIQETFRFRDKDTIVSFMQNRQFGLDESVRYLVDRIATVFAGQELTGPQLKYLLLAKVYLEWAPLTSIIKTSRPTPGKVDLGEAVQVTTNGYATTIRSDLVACVMLLPAEEEVKNKKPPDSQLTYQFPDKDYIVRFMSGRLFESDETLRKLLDRVATIFAGQQFNHTHFENFLTAKLYSKVIPLARILRELSAMSERDDFGEIVRSNINRGYISPIKTDLIACAEAYSKEVKNRKTCVIL